MIALMTPIFKVHQEVKSSLIRRLHRSGFTSLNHPTVAMFETSIVFLQYKIAFFCGSGLMIAFKFSIDLIFYS